jgi:hypothetical protein
MSNARFCSYRFTGSLPLVLAGIILALPLSLNGQTTAATTQNSAAAEPQLPAEVQTQLDKLQDTLKAARAADDAKTEAKTLNQIGEVYFGVSAYQRRTPRCKGRTACCRERFC